MVSETILHVSVHGRVEKDECCFQIEREAAPAVRLFLQYPCGFSPDPPASSNSPSTLLAGLTVKWTNL